jgi:hypothetical protein
MSGMIPISRSHLARLVQERHERHVDEEAIIASLLKTENPQRLKERQTLDVAHRAADFAYDNIYSWRNNRTN